MTPKAETADQADAPRRIAAILFERDEEVDAIVAAFVAARLREGARVAGFLQQRRAGAAGERDEVSLRDVETGETLAIMQRLGPSATGCRLDPAAIAEAAGRLGQALQARPHLVAINRFGKLEAEGGGLLAELAQAVDLALPVLICVPHRFRAAWRAFAGDLDAELPPLSAALEAWWAQSRPPSSRSLETALLA